MRKRTKAKYVGFFVIASVIVLLIISALFIAKQRLDKSNTFVLYFPGSLAGLHIGSDVNYRGIKVGEVTGIALHIDPLNTESIIPVYIQFLDVKTKGEAVNILLQKLIEKGLRGRLVTTNMLTNEKQIKLDYWPDTEPKLYEHQDLYLEIPTIPAEPPLFSINKALETGAATLDEIKNIIASEEVKKTIVSTSNTMNNADILLGNINNQIDPLMIQLTETTMELKETAYYLKTLTEYLSRHPESLIIGKSTKRHGQ